MPHKRNPVSSMIALAAAARTPQRAAALLAGMGQEHERGLGNWQAELAEWPGMFLSAHGALTALAEAMAGLHVDTVRMRRNIDALQGLVFAEAVSIYLAAAIGRPQAHGLMEQLTQLAVANGKDLAAVITHHVKTAVKTDTRLRDKIDLSVLQTLFDPVAATEPAETLARQQLQTLRTTVAALQALT
jgi:3-carboxy-cis,cis-muconate cycloisomerase